MRWLVGLSFVLSGMVSLGCSPSSSGGSSGGDTGSQPDAEPQSDSEDPPSCEASVTSGTISQQTAEPAKHHDVGTEIEYGAVPPSIGDHFGQWAAWGAFEEALDPRFWVHNLEHGGLAFLYDCPDGCDELFGRLKSYVEGVPEDDGGTFRYILTPYANLGAQFAVVAWGWTFKSDDFVLADVECFVKEHYRKGPEDVASPGSHSAAEDPEEGE